MTIQRGHNARRQPGQIGAVPIELEMAALDDLGPKTRYAICNAPLAILAEPIVRQVIERNDEIEAENVKRAEIGLPLRPYLDPNDPTLDDFMARNVIKLSLNLLMRERSLEDALAGVQPLKTARAQRRAYR